MELCRDLAQVGAADRPVVGGKGASLGELASAGIRVPPGFVVTTAAFRLAMEAVDPGGAARRAAGQAGAADAAAELRERILATPPPDAVSAQVAARYRAVSAAWHGADRRGADRYGADRHGADRHGADRHGADRYGHSGEPRGHEVPVAVRSSATAEDSGDASFAGLQDTDLWVRGEGDVLASVRRCWASLYSPESLSYASRLPAETSPDRQLPAMAVVVQRMVDARCAGVMFTCSPTTGDRSVVAIEATWGLGSALVSGCVTPDTYLVSKVTGEVVKRTVPVKARQHQRAPDGAGVAEADVPADLRQAACLTGEEVGELVRLARQVEDHYGSPQDIEWAIAGGGDGGVFVLQSRPETVWAARGKGPVAVPKRRPFDHVFDRLGGSAGGAGASGAARGSGGTGGTVTR